MGTPAPTPPPTAVVGFGANTTGASYVLIVGTVVDIPVPNAQVLSGVTVDGANVLFTVPNTALYRISYHLNTTLGILVGTRLLINGGVFTPASIPVSLGRARFEAEVEMQLTAGSTVKLQLVSGLIGTAVLLGGGAGASLMILELS
ncbi:MAG: collagen-like triple helix repeat-containing protein [Eubacteriales bacterium]|nr:collagen-like triple helix repeat-containing protein [Eubacteriales bacterium]